MIHQLTSLQPSVKSALHTSGYTRCDQLEHASPTALAEKCAISLRDAAVAIQASSAAANNNNNNKAKSSSRKRLATVNAFDLWCLEQQTTELSIPSFCKELDDMLGGGFPLGSVTEVCGAPGVGKTQMCMQLATSVHLPSCFGGLEGKCLYIDTEGSFVPGRFREIAQAAVTHIAHSVHKQQQKRSAADTTTTTTKVTNDPLNAIRESVDEFTVAKILSDTSYYRAHHLSELLALITLLPSIVHGSGGGAGGGVNEDDDEEQQRMGEVESPLGAAGPVATTAASPSSPFSRQSPARSTTPSCSSAPDVSQQHQQNHPDNLTLTAVAFPPPAAPSPSSPQNGQHRSSSRSKSAQQQNQQQNQKSIKLIIIDSVAFLFRSEFGAEYSERSKMLFQFGRELQLLAKRLNIAIVVSNQMTTPSGPNSNSNNANKMNNSGNSGSFSSSSPGGLVPALGDAWAHTVTNRLVLNLLPREAVIRPPQIQQQPQQQQQQQQVATTASVSSSYDGEYVRVARLVKSSFAEVSSCLFRISRKGIRGVVVATSSSSSPR